MTQFNNVSIDVNANIYFDGKVTSRTVTFADGTTKTLGVMLPGDYEFNTEARELMEINAGELNVQLPGEDWKKIVAPDSFYVPANASFKLEVSKTADYCCSYLK